MLEEKLTAAGFSKNEAKVYISLLELGKSKLTSLSRHAGLNHVTTLANLKSLSEKGVIYRQVENQQKFYYIENPKHGLRKYLQLLQSDLNKKKTMIDDAMEGFEVRYAALDARADVKFLEGDDFFTTLRAEIDNSEFETIYELTNLDGAYSWVPPKRGDHRTKMQKRDIKSVSLYSYSKGAVLEKKHTKKKQAYYLAPGSPEFNGEVSVFGDKCALISFAPGREGVIIKNKQIAKTLRALFKLAIRAVKNEK